MTQKEILLQEIEDVSEDLLRETLDFVRFLKSRQKSEILETVLASESSLKKDWLKLEEDKVWADL